ncbi:DNA-binding domain-containing protein [Legionella sp. 16cNR16C]|uniref:HvfC/BufC N-terminal domain-containing protein n=1 Tax=Legionella sp. 16cNR16C TaxID=2905656 RepID=UPI001E5DD59A|nr:DNA-binding domain-containing protein [Legionella sp. 16cNR16C]MCE3046403.1 DNA-binding domain-containing protein [Legionella sp. 16cNR16C]
MKFEELSELLQNSMLTLEPVVKPHLCQPPRGSIEDRISIYANGFYNRLEEALMDDYPALVTVMGESNFHNMSRKYINAYPSSHYSLDLFGQQLRQFLLETVPFSRKPYLSEIAAFEWARSTAITSHDATLLYEADLQKLSPEEWLNLKFYLHPSCEVIGMHWNSLILAETAGQGRSILKPKKLKNPQFVLIWRRQLEVCHHKLDHLELLLINAIRAGATFMEICDQISYKMTEENAAAYIVQKLHFWLHNQLLVKPE